MKRTPRGFPRHMLLRLVTLDMVRAMVDACAQPVMSHQNAEFRGRAAVLCSRITQHRDKAFRLTVGGDRLDLSEDNKASCRYSRQISAMREDITRSWGASISATEFIASVLLLVAKAEEQLPRTMDYMDDRAEWGRLHTLVAKLYAIFDPDYADAHGIDYGATVGERMAAHV